MTNRKIEKGQAMTVATPYTMPNGVVLKNRLAKSAMSEQLADDGRNPTEGLACLYRRWAAGGTGLLITGNIMVDRRHVGEARNVVLQDDSDLEAFRRWTRAGTEHGAQFWAQLNHPGKQTPATLTWEPVAPSAIALGEGFQLAFRKPRALRDEEILGIVAQFARSAALAKRVGFTGVQIHGAHGYLVNQFLSPRHNRRSDRWGGSLENRMRFVLETYRAIRAEVGADFPVGIKLNSADFQHGGFSEEESMQVVQALTGAGIDLIEISGGTYESPTMTGEKVASSSQRREAYFLAYAEQLRRRVKTPLMVTGGFRSGGGIAAALDSGATDLIGLSRPLAIEPDFSARLLADPDHRVEVRRLTTGNRRLDHISLLNITWYEHQLARMAVGKAPLPGLNVWRSLAITFRDMGLSAFATRRA